MANKPNTEDGKANEGADVPAKEIDYVKKIGGNFNLHNATALFGEENAVQALQAYAQFGGHGVITEADFKSSLFGGLGAPAEEDTQRRGAINTALNNLVK